MEVMAAKPEYACFWDYSSQLGFLRDHGKGTVKETIVGIWIEGGGGGQDVGKSSDKEVFRQRWGGGGGN